MKRLAIIIALIIVFSKVSSAFAGSEEVCPDIDSIEVLTTDQIPVNGISSGGSIIISGSNFGTNAAVNENNIQWLGANIEAGTDGDVFSKTNWAGTTDSGNSRAPRYDDDGQVHSGANAILIPYTSTYYKGYIRYDAGGTASPVYISYWMYGDLYTGSWTPLTSYNQWKSFRITKSDSVADKDAQPGIVVSRYGHQNFPTDNNADWGCYPWPCGDGMQDDDGLPDDLSLASGSGDYGYDHLTTNNGLMPGGTNYRDKWVRVDMYIYQGTRGNFDGTFQYWITNPGVSIKEPNDMDDYVGKCLIKNTAANLRYIFISQYNNGSLDVYIDDVFIQIGTQARVEIGDKQVWEDCTHREIQIPTAWKSTGDSIKVTVNRGSFVKDDTAYLFVVDSEGNASLGFPVVFLMDTVILEPIDSDG